MNIENVIKQIDNAFYNSLRFEEEVILYRGVKNCNVVFDGISNSYLSTSKNINIAKGFGTCLYEYHVQESVPYIYLETFTLNKGEEEYLLPRNLLLTYIKTKNIDNYITYVINVELLRSDQFVLREEYENYNLFGIDIKEEYDIKGEKYIEGECYKNRFIKNIDGYYPVDELTG